MRRTARSTAIAIGAIALLTAAAPPAPHSIQDDVAYTWAQRLGADGYAHAQPAGVVAGFLVRLDENGCAAPGDHVDQGVYFAPLGAQLLDDVSDYQLDPDWIITFGSSAIGDATRCRVRCRAGYFACCLINGDRRPVCRCRLIGTADDDCQAGGDGADECEIEKRPDV